MILLLEKEEFNSFETTFDSVPVPWNVRIYNGDIFFDFRKRKVPSIATKLVTETVSCNLVQGKTFGSSIDWKQIFSQRKDSGEPEYVLPDFRMQILWYIDENLRKQNVAV